jgi:hypothetical protein
VLQRLRRRPALAGWSKPTPIRDQGAKAYRKGRQRERDVILPDGTTHAGRTPAHWRRVALMVARMTCKRVGVGTATRMLEPGSGWSFSLC